MRTFLLLTVLCLATAVVGCLGGDDESTPTGDEGIGSSGVDGTGSGGVTNTTAQQPETSAMCVEGAEDCDDTPSYG